jgi:hypothetical protein
MPSISTNRRPPTEKVSTQTCRHCLFRYTVPWFDLHTYNCWDICSFFLLMCCILHFAIREIQNVCLPPTGVLTLNQGYESPPRSQHEHVVALRGCYRYVGQAKGPFYAIVDSQLCLLLWLAQIVPFGLFKSNVRCSSYRDLSPPIRFGSGNHSFMQSIQMCR